MLEWTETDVAIFGGRNLQLLEQERHIQTFKGARIWLERGQGCGSHWTIMVQRSSDTEGWNLAQGQNRRQARYALGLVEGFQWINLEDCRRQVEEASWLPNLFTGTELVCGLLLVGVVGLALWYGT